MGWIEDQHDWKRHTLEDGPGGDWNKPYKYKSPEHWSTVAGLHTLISLMRLVLNGQLGGKEDGNEDEREEAAV